MKKNFLAAAFVAGMVGPVSAATVIDFTADNSTSGTAGGGYTVTSSGTLSNPTHGNNIGCTGTGWNFACAPAGIKYDVGFGVRGTGTNPNEIDGAIKKDEWVQVTFGYAVKVLGFAGMLAYFDSVVPAEGPRGKETVVLQYLNSVGAWVTAGEADPLNDDNDPTNVGNDNFGTVGLAWKKGIAIDTTAVRFTASGINPFDDGNANITAAGLIIAPVPVPASFPLLLAGIGALGWAARRKRKAA